MMLPILISVSLAPTSYFFCALAAVAVAATAAANAVTAKRLLIRDGIVLSPLGVYFDQVSQDVRAHASSHLFRGTKQHCCSSPIMIDAGAAAGLSSTRADGLNPKLRIGPRHPRLGASGFHAARWLAARTIGAAGFHQLGSDFADERIARIRESSAAARPFIWLGSGLPARTTRVSRWLR